VTVTPASAQVWLDGRPLSVGSTTAADVVAGEHALLLTCPGFLAYAGVVAVRGDGKLDHVPVFLTPLAGAEQRAALATALVSALGTPREAVAVRQLADVLAVEGVVLVGPDPLAAGSVAPVAWALAASGERRGGYVPMSGEGGVSGAAGSVIAALRGSGSPAAELARPWYRRWPVWAAAAGAALVGGGLAWYLTRDPGVPDRVSFYVGRP
jgi:hypothetical protein